jgi:hypothetical protein
MTDKAFLSSSYTYIISPKSFKAVVQHNAPAVSADNVNRIIVGYNSETMEWSNNVGGAYSSGTPAIGNGAQAIYVRMKAYDTIDPVFGYVKKGNASDVVKVEFTGFGETKFPLRTSYGILVADENTRYVTSFKQSGDIITATISLRNEKPTAEYLSTMGIGISLAFDGRVSPCDANGNNVFPAGSTHIKNDVIKTYMKAMIPGFSLVSSDIVQSDASGNGMLGCSFTCWSNNDILKIHPGQSVDLVQLFFKVKNNNDKMNIDMFNYTYLKISNTHVNSSPFIAYGYSFVYPIRDRAQPYESYVVSPGSFKIDMQRPVPNVYADQDIRKIVNFDLYSMEWAYYKDGPYYSGTPYIGDDEITIYVRAKGDAGYNLYPGTFTNFKKYVPSESVMVKFIAKSWELRNKATGYLVANKFTEYNTVVSQDPYSRLITATIQVKHGGGNTNEPLQLNGVSFALGFNEKIAPYSYGNGNALYGPGVSLEEREEFKKYIANLYSAPNIISSTVIRRNNFNGGWIGAMITSSTVENCVVKYGETKDILKVYFMPVNMNDTLDAKMIKHTQINDVSFYNSPWIGYGGTFMLSYPLVINPPEYRISPESFNVKYK